MAHTQHQQLTLFKKNRLAVKAKHIAIVIATVFSFTGTSYFLSALDHNSQRMTDTSDLGVDCESVVTEYSLNQLDKGSALSKDRLQEWDHDNRAFIAHGKETVSLMDISRVATANLAYQDMESGHKKLGAFFNGDDDAMHNRAMLDSVLQWESQYLGGVNALVANYQEERASIMERFKLFVIGLAISFLALTFLNYIYIVRPIQEGFKKSLDEIIDQRTRLRTLVDGTEELIWSVDTTGHLLMFNNAFETFYKNRYHRSPWRNMDISEVDYFKSHQPAYDETLKKNTITLLQEKIEKRVYELRFDPIVKEDVVTGCLVRRTDVTDREKVINEIKKGREDLLEAQEIANMGSWAWDITNDKIDWSDQLFKIFGQAKGDFAPRHESLKQLIHPEDRKAFDYAIKRCLGKQSKSNFDMVYRILVHQQTRFVHQHGRVFKDLDGTPTRMAGTLQDVTEKVLSEQKIERQNKELRHFVNVISHNLRRPLSNLLGLVHLYEDGHHQDNDFLLDHIRSSGNDLDQTIKDLNHSLSLKDVDPKNFMDVELSEVMDDVEFLLREQIHESGAKLKVYSDCCSLRGIKRYYVDILYHLISNAMTFAKPGKVPSIKLSVINHPNHIVIRVRDNGIGMKLTPENHKKIFDMYGRLSGRTTGKGLGLYLVRNQLEAMNGVIDVHSKPDEGSLFEIRIGKSPEWLEKDKKRLHPSPLGLPKNRRGKSFSEL